jgi:phospholipid transport system substrate-binding protein
LVIITLLLGITFYFTNYFSTANQNRVVTGLQEELASRTLQERGLYDLGRRGEMNILGFLILILLLMVPMAMPMASAGNREATEVVDKLQMALLTVMKDGEKLGYRGRYDQLDPVIRASFDMSLISRIALSKYWGTLNEEQQSKFVETFSRLSIATYAANFSSYSGERFKVTSEKEVSSGRILVQTQLIKSDGGKVTLDYLLNRANSEWRIINVIAEGVSDLAMKRADYSNFLKNKSFEALIVMLNEKIAQYSR